MKKATQSCCSGASNCCKLNNGGISNKKLIIDFLYLDLSVCERCQGTEAILEEAIADVSHVLKAAGIDIIVNKVNIISKELAEEHQFISSPTIRVNGHDIDVEAKENLCESCGDLCGESCDCRVWTYQGAEYNVPPKPLIINALLKEIYSPPVKPQDKEYVLPQNLENFFIAMENKEKPK